MAITQPHPSYLVTRCALPKKWQPTWSDEDRSADASAAASFAFGHLSNFDALWRQNRWSDFDQISAQEFLIALYLWLNFHPILFSRFGDTRGGLTQLDHTLVKVKLWCSGQALVKFFYWE